MKAALNTFNLQYHALPGDMVDAWDYFDGSGVDMWLIAGIMGDSIATVTKHYAKYHPDVLKKPTDMMAELMNKYENFYVYSKNDGV